MLTRAVEEKYKPKGVNGDDKDDDEDSSSDEDEDEDGFLATEELDAEISATLAAIKNKDPRIYDKNAKFFNALDEHAPAPREKKEKPMTLHDYHRSRYMAGDTGADNEAEAEAEADVPRTFVQEQADLKKELLAEIKAGEGSDDDEEDEDFIKSKPGQTSKAASDIHPSRQERVKPKAKDLDIALADKDPDLYLSNFMASRAWATQDGSKWEAFESDEGEGNDDADEWETAYNLRFEDPAKSNEVLMSYSRKVVEARSVRREEPKGRKRQRELEKERKEEEKRQRHEERARLKRLKIEEAEDKLKKIKKAAGLKGKALKDDEWMALLDDAWENDKWEEEMNRRFGEQYYAELDGPDSEEEEDDDDDEAGDGAKSKKSKKPKKPKWDDDIDIKDLVPDFEDEEARPNITLSDAEAEEAEQDAEAADASDSSSHPATKRPKSTKALKYERQAAKRASRRARAQIEALVESRMELDNPTVLATAAASSSHKKDQKQPAASAGGFRYRETSPQAFGLTPRDILLAPSDAALNDFVGLKKLASFRDREKKQKDKKRLGKKARLREWRREVFGREFEHTGPTFGFSGSRDAAGAEEQVDQKAGQMEAEAGESKKRKRSKGKKKSSA